LPSAAAHTASQLFHFDVGARAGRAGWPNGLKTTKQKGGPAIRADGTIGIARSSASSAEPAMLEL